MKTISRNGIGNKFMNDCTICFVELERFQKMGNRNWKMLMRDKYH